MREGSFATNKGSIAAIAVWIVMNDGSFVAIKVLLAENDGSFVAIKVLLAANDGSFVAITVLLAVNDGSFVAITVLLAMNNGSFVAIKVLFAAKDGLFVTIKVSFAVNNGLFVTINGLIVVTHGLFAANDGSGDQDEGFVVAGVDCRTRSQRWDGVRAASLGSDDGPRAGTRHRGDPDRSGRVDANARNGHAKPLSALAPMDVRRPVHDISPATGSPSRRVPFVIPDYVGNMMQGRHLPKNFGGITELSSGDC
jgi:hypothetical protein